MKIDGREISQLILEDLKKQVEKLKLSSITPHLYILLLTDDPSAKSYVNQKSLKSQQIGTEITIETVNPKIETRDLLQKINKLNKDNSIHGIIVQRPVPSQIREEDISKAIAIEKDIDGFCPNSKFSIPVALAVFEILQNIKNRISSARNLTLKGWLKGQKITVIGNGLTAGGPIIRSFKNLGIEPLLITSKTENKKELLRNSDIIISAVGKANIVEDSMIKKGVILIGVGMHREKDGKFHGDYDERNIEDTASFYTPTPGGVGPLNVAMLLRNLVQAAGK
jgi:methylenetetrahydrofolate dehydrogenase (NADP+)/methenyltetrahydrofolate cyclohydrolase